MKKLFLFLFLVTLGCGSGGSSGGGSPTSPGTAPKITNMGYLPGTAAQGEGGGAISVIITFDFADAEADIKTFKVWMGGITIDAASGLAGIYEGTPGFTDFYTGNVVIFVVAPTDQTGTFPFSIWVQDSAGHESNKLSGAFIVS